MIENEILVEKRIKDLDELKEYSKILSQKILNKVVILTGDLGAGKTTLCNLLCTHLGVHSGLSSPTFSVINEYSTEDATIYHMDWYRIETLEDLMNIGIEEYLYSGHTCLIEWPQVGADLLPDGYIHIDIKALADESRVVKIVSAYAT